MASGTVSALVAVATRAGTSIVAIWSTDGGAEWRQSQPLPLAKGALVASTGIAPGEFVIMTKNKESGPLRLAAVTEPSQAWEALPSPPSQTAAVVVGAAGVIDALAVSSAKFTDWRLTSATDAWGRVQTMTVPIVIGSSS
jgi:hypothetical protein